MKISPITRTLLLICCSTVVILAQNIPRTTELSNSPVIRISPDSLRFEQPRFLTGRQDFRIYNDGDQPLNVSVTDRLISARPGKSSRPHFSPAALQRLIQHLSRQAPARWSGRSAAPSLLPPAGSGGATDVLTTVISDPAGDVTAPGIDVTAVDMAISALTYDFTIHFAGTPDTLSLAIVSIDLDQNFATGSFPPPLGLGPAVFDVGAEYDIIFDIGNFLGDSLGLPPTAFVIEAGDTSFTPVGISFPLTFTSTAVTANFLRVITPPILDNNLNASALTLSLGTISLPDFAPDFGHGLLGQENGLSWLAESDTAGNSAIPFQATIAAGESLTVSTRAASVNPEGVYRAEIQIANNSSNNPVVLLPVNLAVMGLAAPAIQVSPAAFSDTLQVNQPPVTYSFSVFNGGDGTLIFFVDDSLAPGEDWLTLPILPLNQVDPGGSAALPVTVDPSGLAAGQSYLGLLRFFSNDPNRPQVDVPLEIFVQSPVGIGTPAGVPGRLSLYPNFPNPFNPTTRIRFDLPQQRKVLLQVFDVNGRLVRTLASGLMPGGQHSVEWDGRNDNGFTVASGIYLLRLSAGKQLLVRQMILLK